MDELKSVVSTITTNMQKIYRKGINDGIKSVEGEMVDDMKLAVLNSIKYRTPLEFGAVGDGVTDDTVAIQSCLDACDYVFIPRGKYAISVLTPLKPHSNQTIVFDEQATITCVTVDDADSGLNYSVFHLVNVSNVIISGGNIEGDRFIRNHTNKYYRGHNIAITGGENITIDGVNMYNSFNDCICIGPWTKTDAEGNYVKDGDGNYIRLNCNGLTIKNCKLHDFGRSAISNCGCDNFKLLDTEAYNWLGVIMPGSIIDFEPDYTWNSNLFIDNLYGHDALQGVIVTVKNTDFTMTNSRIVGFQTQIAGDVLVKNCMVSNYLGCKGPGRAQFEQCTSKGILVMKNTGKVVATNCVFTGDEESKDGPVILCEGAVPTEDNPTLHDASNAQIECYNCVMYSRASNDIQTSQARSSILWSEVYSIKEMYFDRCAFNFRNNIKNAFRAERFTFQNCSFNIDGITDAIDVNLCTFGGRDFYSDGAAEKFVFLNNSVRIGNASLSNIMFAINSKNCEFNNNVLSVDKGKAILTGNVLTGVITARCSVGDGELVSVNNVCPDFNKFVVLGSGVTGVEHNNFEKSAE